MIITVPLSKLSLSDRNVRKTNRDEDIGSLAEDIAARGLKQNLVVTEVDSKKGFYEVDAGGRRFQALQLLAADKRIPRNHPVPVLVEAAEHALETSLAENLHRVAMNPADEFDAFAAIIAGYDDGGMSDPTDRIANCARRFGVTVRHVEQRLRLAALAPEILETLREARISLEAAKAYAAYSDQALQLKTFKAEEKKGNWAHSAQSIRDAMKGKVYRLDDRRVRYITVDAYIAAGGQLERELFMSAEDQDVILDTALVDRLVMEKAAPEADRLAQANGFLAGILNLSQAYYQLPKPPKGYKEWPSWKGGDRMPSGLRAEAIQLFRIDIVTAALEPTDDFFVKAQARDDAATSASSAEGDEERWARQRAQAIEQRAARLAAPKFAGTPFEGRAFWPNRRWIDPVERGPDGSFLVTVQIRVEAADVEGAKAEAERIHEAELAAKEASTSADPDRPDPYDDELDTDEQEGAAA